LSGQGWGGAPPEPHHRPPTAEGDRPPGAPAKSLTPLRDGPPRRGIFTLAGRRAPGLYLVSWALSITGLVLFMLIGPMASSDTARLALVSIGAIVLTVGLATACGYQVLERGDRHPDAYRGPAPLLVFAAYFFALALVGVVVIVSGIADPDAPLGFFAIGSLQAVGYGVVVWLLVIRTGALTWSQMGWPSWRGRALQPTLRGIGAAVAVMIPTTFVLLIVGGLIGTLLGVEAPEVLPTPDTTSGALLVAATAAVIIPIGEELFFRGFALTAWLRDLGPRTALIRSSVFFALIHIVNITTSSFSEGLGQAVLQTTVILPVGFVLGWLFLRHGMAGAIGGHVTYNSLLLLLALLVSYLPEPT